MTSSRHPLDEEFRALLRARDWQAILKLRRTLDDELDPPEFAIEVASAVATIENDGGSVAILAAGAYADRAAAAPRERALAWCIWLACVKRRMPGLAAVATIALSADHPAGGV